MKILILTQYIEYNSEIEINPVSNHAHDYECSQYSETKNTTWVC